MSTDIDLKFLLDSKKMTLLKCDFLLRHAKYQNLLHEPYPEIHVNLKENDIFYFDAEGNEFVENFYSDYLCPKIRKIPEIMKVSIHEEIENKGIYSNSAIENYAAKQLTNLLDTKDKILNLNYLNQDVKDLLDATINEVYKYIQTELRKDVITVKNKIPLNLSRIEIVLLIQMLSNNEYLNRDKIGKRNLFLKIEDAFEYFDSNTKQYLPLKNTRKLYNELFGDQKKNKPYEKALKDLKNKLMDEEFYELLEIPE